MEPISSDPEPGIQISIAAEAIYDLYYRRCRDGDSKPRFSKANADDVRQRGPEQVQIQLQHHEYVVCTDALPAEHNYTDLHLQLDLRFPTTSELVALLSYHPIELCILEYDPQSSSSSRIAISCVDVLQAILTDATHDGISFPIVYVNEMAAAKDVSPEPLPPRCLIRVHHDPVSLDRIRVLHLNLDQIQVDDPDWSRSDSGCRFVKDDVEVEVELSPMLPAPVFMLCSASSVCSLGSGSGQISTSPFYLYHQLTPDQCQSLSHGLEESGPSLLRFHIKLQRALYMVDRETWERKQADAEFDIDLKRLSHPIPALSQTEIRESVTTTSSHVACRVSISLHPRLQPRSIPTPLQLLRNDQQARIWNDGEALAHDLIQSDINLGTDMLRSGWDPDLILYSHLRPRFATHLRRLQEALRSGHEPGWDMADIRVILHDTIHAWCRHR